MSEMPDMPTISNLSLEEQRDYDYAESLRRCVNPQVTDLSLAKLLIKREGVEEALNGVPKIAADWSNYPTWKEAFDNVISSNFLFKLVTTKQTEADFSEDEQAVIIVMTRIMSRKLDDYLEDEEFAYEIEGHPVYEKIELINAQYENLEYNRRMDDFNRRSDMLTTLAEDFYISNPSESNSDNIQNRIEYLEKLQEHPAMIVPSIVLAELSQLVTDSGKPPVSYDVLKLRFTEAVGGFENEDITDISVMISKCITIMKELLKQRDVMSLDAPVHPKRKNQANASAEVIDRKKGYREKPFIKLWKKSSSTNYRDVVPKSGPSKAVFYKYFYSVKLCPFCYRENVDFATHDCFK